MLRIRDKSAGASGVMMPGFKKSARHFPPHIIIAFVIA
jgi:hypothetical protein